jgi:DNA topoisomerase IB
MRRRRAGRGFVYLDDRGARVTDAGTLARIRDLAIPPAWRDVWICADPRGHIQATGTDARGRRQYRYHDRWRAARDREKFDRMLRFGRALPAVRRRLERDMAPAGLPREKALACAVRLLDLGFFRIGTEGYADENETYGLATMLKRHTRIDGDTVVFDFAAKGGKRRVQSIVDGDVHEIVAALKRRRGGGPELLAWKDGRRWVDVRSSDINEYIKIVAGDEFTAKDFRTWNATVLAAVALAVSSHAGPPSGRKRAVARAMQEVGHYLGNTPAVARSSYVDPRVVDRYMEGVTIHAALERIGEGATFGHPSTQGAIERAVLEMLDESGEIEAEAS